MKANLILVVILILFTLHLLIYYANSKPVIFDITTYGAKPHEDISKALSMAWKDASGSRNPSKIVIPRGKWILSQVKLEGPNLAPLEIQNRGIIKANPNPNTMPNKEEEWITINYVNYFTLSGGGIFDGQGQESWKRNHCNTNNKCPKLPINLSFNFINNSVIRDVTTKDSKNFHVKCISSINMTFVRFTVSAPGDSPNTDGIHVARSKTVNIIDSVIGTGDDCISMGDDLAQVHIRNVTCGPGHGISIGSLGKDVNERDISGIHVANCTFINTQNGVRVKTWPSAPGTLRISDLHFEDLVMVNAGYPVVIDQEYCPWNNCNRNNPSLIQISHVSINNVRGTTNTKEAMSLICSSKKPCEDVRIGEIHLSYTRKRRACNTICANINPIIFGHQNPRVCASKSAEFVNH